MSQQHWPLAGGRRHLRARNLADVLLVALLSLLLVCHLVMKEEAEPVREPALAKPPAGAVKSLQDPLSLVAMQLPAPAPAPMIGQGGDASQHTAPAQQNITPLQPLAKAPDPVVNERLEPRAAEPRARPARVEIKPLQAAPRPTAHDRESATASTIELHRQQGQHLLQQLEHGKGPNIEIAWPDSASERNQLFRQLHNCEGVRVARLHRGRLVAVEGGSPREMSGFVRVVSGQIPSQERELLGKLSGGGTPVRLFPRRFDAVMLGALASLVGPQYSRSRQIRGHYQWQRGQLRITRISVDGRTVPGAISLSQTNCR